MTLLRVVTTRESVWTFDLTGRTYTRLPSYRLVPVVVEVRPFVRLDLIARPGASDRLVVHEPGDAAWLTGPIESDVLQEILP